MASEHDSNATNKAGLGDFSTPHTGPDNPFELKAIEAGPILARAELLSMELNPHNTRNPYGIQSSTQSHQPPRTCDKKRSNPSRKSGRLFMSSSDIDSATAVWSFDGCL